MTIGSVFSFCGRFSGSQGNFGRSDPNYTPTMCKLGGRILRGVTGEGSSVRKDGRRSYRSRKKRKRIYSISTLLPESDLIDVATIIYYGNHETDSARYERWYTGITEG